MSNALSKQATSRKRKLAALRIAAIYAFVGGIWILFSDQMLAAIATDLEMFRRMQTFKGWFYVVATAGMLYALIKQSMKAVQHSEDALHESEERFRKLVERAADALFLHDSVNFVGVCDGGPE